MMLTTCRLRTIVLGAMLVSFLCPTAALDAALAKRIMEGITAKQLEAQVCADYATPHGSVVRMIDRGE